MKFKWTVEIEVDESWVADGFNLTQDRLRNMVENELPHAFDYEIGCKILNTPRLADIAKAQGYKSVADMKKSQVT